MSLKIRCNGWQIKYFGKWTGPIYPGLVVRESIQVDHCVPTRHSSRAKFFFLTTAAGRSWCYSFTNLSSPFRPCRLLPRSHSRPAWPGSHARSHAFGVRVFDTVAWRVDEQPNQGALSIFLSYPTCTKLVVVLLEFRWAASWWVMDSGETELLSNKFFGG
jgi:hypothetical protein